ncbi:BF3164 family lipoprotein [Parabacteroides sp. AF14-59]|uniref:BF3164 family lipoprotein n=1 Tax=Parabacteroides sp. AF14-59 TaxID=2292240 RepID=UPI000F00BCCA|nr:BF3164 family lipoprotein [Parabacteroides sp. AF14-59]RHR91209.1 hypothetical protein DWW23_26155 [Parabacteroides sp. AF14-59]
MKTIYLLFILAFIIQCSVPKKEKPYEFTQTSTITFNDAHYPEMLEVTMQLIKKDSTILINDFYGDSLVKVFNLNTKMIEKKLISKGEGPNELLSPLDIQIADNNLYLLSRPLFMLNHIPLKAITSDDNIKLYKDYQMPPKSDCFIPLNKSQFVFSGLWDKRYALLNLEQDSIEIFGEYPNYWEGEKDIPTEAKAMFHQCMFTKNETKNLFASCSWFILEIYKYEPNKLKIPTLIFQKQLGKYSYDYTTTDHISTKMRKGSDPCVTEITSSSKYIYMIIQSKENKKNRDIMVIDWNGNPIKLLKSDKRITCLTVDEKSKKAYCIIEDPEDKLVYFDL